MKNARRITSEVILLLLITSSYAFSQDRHTEGIRNRLLKWENPLTEWGHIGKLRLDSVKRGSGDSDLNIYFSTALSYYPLREDNISRLRQSVVSVAGRKYRKYNFRIYSNGFLVEELIPNIFRSSLKLDSSRIRRPDPSGRILVTNLHDPKAGAGLSGRSVALWHSHGYYYEMNLDRWEWQRARLFGTVEDISVMGYVLPYLTEMLENAGANVFLPRERDTQVNEVIVDNDGSRGTSEVVIQPSAEVQFAGPGFLIHDTLFQGMNPFRLGTSVRIAGGTATYIPEIPDEGYYYVSVSYPSGKGYSENVIYTVNHTGGSTIFRINQTIGGETWIYLGKFHFRKGKNAGIGSVTISSGSAGSGFTGLDAVRFGGGMGNVARRPSKEVIANQRSVSEKEPEVKTDTPDVSSFTWKVSNKPRYLEGSRYWLQYAGMPDTLVYSPNTYKNDYNDDYQSRGGWVNYLMAPAEGFQTEGQRTGLGIPLDLSLAFHTDAGITPGDSVIGTLAIYSTAAGNGKFPDGSSRLASRDLSDIIQTQIVSDMRTLYDTEWTRRGLWDRSYSEARRPDVPAMLLELLSHQNLADQRYGLDPRFRFDVSRAIYKGILRYVAYNENRGYVVQPLKVSDLAIMPLGGRKIRLSWKPVLDTLEPSARPDRYRIYMRTGENGFDNGFITRNTSAEIELPSYGEIYSFRVAAVNEGGEGFGSEILSAGFMADDQPPVLVVNGFDRVSGPEWFDRDNMAGVAWWSDRGVADRYDISSVGNQYDFDRKSPWLDDDAPGWGASYADLEGRIIPGNTFDNVMIHGSSILRSGRSFVSVSDEYFCSPGFNPSGFIAADLIFGEEKSTVSFIDPGKTDFRIFTPELMNRIACMTDSGISIFISGAYIGSDLLPAGDSAAIKFAAKFLHYSHRTGHAVNNGAVYSTDIAKPDFRCRMNFNTGNSDAVYAVESPGAIEPAGRGAKCVLRYSQNNTSAGVAFSGKNRTFAMGFPFETIIKEEERDLLMKQILDFLSR